MGSKNGNQIIKADIPYVADLIEIALGRANSSSTLLKCDAVHRNL